MGINLEVAVEGYQQFPTDDADALFEFCLPFNMNEMYYY